MPTKPKPTTTTPALTRDNFTQPPLDHPDLAHIVPDLRPLAIPVEVLIKLPGNYHQGDIGVVSASLGTFNQRKPIVINANTGHIEAGNTTFDATIANGYAWVAGVLVEDDAAMEKAYAVVDNRAQELGWNDPAALSAMLLDVREYDDDLFRITGYDGDDLDDLLKEVGAFDLEGFGDGADAQSAMDHGTVIPGKQPQDRLDSYEASTVRSLVLTYDMAQYVWATEHFSHLRREFGVDNNADVVLHLIAEKRESRFPTTKVSFSVVPDSEDGFDDGE